MAHHKIHDDGLDRPAAAAAPRPAAARAAPAVDRGHAEPGRHRRAGGPAVRARTTARFAAQNLAAARTAWAAAQGQPGHLRRPEPTASAAAPTTTTTSPTSSTGRRPSCTSPPASRQYQDFVLASPHAHRPTSSARARLRLGQHRRARPARPGHRAQRAARTAAAVRAVGRRRAPTRTWPRCRRTRTACRTRPADNMYDWGSNNLILNNMVVLATAYDLTGRATGTATACWRAWTTSSAATRSTSPT